MLAPVALGVVFKARGRGSWGRTDARAAGQAEVERRAAAYGLGPVSWPDPWPPQTLAPMRAAVWAEREGAGDAFARAAFRRAFTAGAGLDDAAELAAIARSVGLPGDELTAALGDQAIKDDLRARTAEALALGLPGAPTVAVGTRLFYGDDQLEAAAAALRAARGGP